MPLVIPPTFAQVIHTLKMIDDPEPMAVTYGIELEQGVVFSPQSVVNGLSFAFVTKIMPVMLSHFTMTETTMRLGTTPPALSEVFVGPGQGQGGITGPSVPQNTAYLVSKRTSKPGRRGRGRMFFPGVSEGAVNNNGTLPPTDTRTQWETRLPEWLVAVAAVDGVVGMVLLHSTGITPAPPPYPVTALQLELSVATQRNRLRR